MSDEARFRQAKAIGTISLPRSYNPAEDSVMAANLDSRHVLWALVAAPFVLFAGYVAYLVVPEVVRVVVPTVVRAIVGR
jgi:hypothetical protein